MRLGILITGIGTFGQNGFYNNQEIGLAKELDQYFDEIIVYKAILQHKRKRKSKIKSCKHSVLYEIPVKSKGINGIWNCGNMDTTLDAVIYFSDTQIAVPNVYKWCCQNNIKMYPYIGVIESHSSSRLKRMLINFLFQRNIRVYRKCTCFVKTPEVKKSLNERGVNDCIVMPVGIDLSLLCQDYKKASVISLKEKYGYEEFDKVLLFIGRMTEEKQPMRMVEVFRRIHAEDQKYKLIMVGKGKLLEKVEMAVADMPDDIQLIDQIPNKDIWELYCIADCFVNLNQQEIFGMAILEAMYYGCKVVAWKAPGPNYIIEDGKSGFIVENIDEAMERIKNGELDEVNIYKRIICSFTWKSVANKISQCVSNRR